MVKRTLSFTFSLSLVILLLASCGGRSFRIEGAITNAKDSTLYLENVGLDGIVSIDSTRLGEDGTFSFSRDADDAPEFYRLRIAKQIINLSIDSTETVSVKAEYPSMTYKYEVSGSENCLKIQELALLQTRLQAQINNIVKDPTLNVRRVQDSILVVIDAYKAHVRDNYIYKEPNKAYAYFALFQTVAVGYNYNLIFNPRTNEDDVKAFAAVATSWDTYYPHALRGQNLHNIAIEGMKNVRILRNREAQYLDPDKVSVTGVIDIELPDSKGVMRKLSDLQGHVVLLDFCSFAQEGVTQRIMQMREIYNKYHAQGLEIYQVSFDTDQHFWKTQTAALPWISVNDPQGIASEYIVRFNLQALPTFFLIDKDSTPYRRDVQIEDFDAEIRTLL